MSGFYERREGYRPADVNAPRFRKQRHHLLTPALFKEYKKKYPNSKIDYKAFRAIIQTFNRRIRHLASTTRDGVEFPFQVGFLFVATCPKKKDNPDVQVSRQYGKKINHKNWESNQYLCKIFYSNYGTKYRFLGRENWYFRPCRNFKVEVSTFYRENWNIFQKISPFEKITSFLRSQGIKSVKVHKHEYKNRRVDFSDTQPD
jgi:hypothetical protein